MHFMPACTCMGAWQREVDVWRLERLGWLAQDDLGWARFTFFFVHFTFTIHSHSMCISPVISPVIHE